MIASIRLIAILSLAGASALAAQGPGRSGGTARLFLSHVGELGLSDAQVVRLAAIERRAEARRKTLRASMDSARSRFGQPADSVARRQFAERMRADVERASEQSQVDQRDALAVLTPDQQARAWDLRSGRGMRGGMSRPGRVGGIRRPRMRELREMPDRRRPGETMRGQRRMAPRRMPFERSPL